MTLVRQSSRVHSYNRLTQQHSTTEHVLFVFESALSNSKKGIIVNLAHE
jgi:hypothetical protein